MKVMLDDGQSCEDFEGYLYLEMMGKRQIFMEEFCEESRNRSFACEFSES